MSCKARVEPSLARTSGIAEDLPTPNDFDGDSKADIAIYRPSAGTWWLNRSTAGLATAPFGTNEDKPVLGDYNGDGLTDLAVFRRSNGTWYWSSDLIDPAHNFVSVPFGLSTDIPTPANFDSDAKTDVAVYRPSNGTWYLVRSSNGSFVATQFGIAEDVGRRRFRRRWPGGYQRVSTIERGLVQT